MRVETEMIAKSNKHFGNLREWWTRCGPFDTARLLQSQAFRTKSCLEALKAGGRDIPQETIDMFAAREKQFEEEALKLDPGEIPEADLVLSPLRLDSQFVDMRAFVGLDPHGSNVRQGLLGFSKVPLIVIDGGVKSVGNQDGSNVLEISDSSVSDSEDGQGREPDKADVGEEVDGARSGEIIGDQANPSESQLEVRGEEAIARVETVDADQPVRSTLPEPSLDHDAVAQEQARDPEELLRCCFLFFFYFE